MGLSQLNCILWRVYNARLLHLRQSMNWCTHHIQMDKAQRSFFFSYTKQWWKCSASEHTTKHPECRKMQGDMLEQR